MSLLFGVTYEGAYGGPVAGGSGYDTLRGLGGFWDDNGLDIIGRGFDLGETFVKSKYAKDASKYTGSYYPQGQTAEAPGGRYQQIDPRTLVAGTARNPDGSLIADTAGKTASSLAKFVEDNLGVLAIGGVFLLAFMRKPGGR
jgi:hypothetical protein